MMRVSGVWVAQAILVLTGNLEIAASLRALPKAWTLPLRLTAHDGGVRLEILTPEQYQERMAGYRRPGPSEIVQRSA